MCLSLSRRLSFPWMFSHGSLTAITTYLVLLLFMTDKLKTENTSFPVLARFFQRK